MLIIHCLRYLELPVTSELTNRGRQREVVDTVRLVGVTEIGQIFPIGDIGFSNDDGIWLGVLNKRPQHADCFVSLFQVDAVGANLFPKECHCIQSEDSNAHI